jgi:hypothetical protein
MVEFEQLVVLVSVFIVTLLAIIRFRKSIQEHTFGSGLVAGDSFKSLNVGDVRAVGQNER